MASTRLDQPLAGETYAFPLSFSQEQLWFLERLHPSRPSYNITAAVRLHGALDPSVLEEALRRVVARHETLRTAFRLVDGEPVQVVGMAVRVPLVTIDLTDHPEGTREDRARAIADQDARKPFDLGEAPLLRCTLVRLAPDDYLFLTTVHHIISDGWSTGIFLRDVSAHYVALVRGMPDLLPELPIQYADYALWQRERLRDPETRGHLDYWRNQLEGAPGLLELPADHARPPQPTLRGATMQVYLPPELSAALRALSRRHNATLFMLLLAAFEVLLARYTGQNDIVVGTPMAGRTQSQMEDLIGFFVNTLPLRLTLEGNPPFAAILDQVRERVLGAQARQELPFSRVVEAFKPARTLAYNPVFQVTFALENQPESQADFSGAGITAAPARPGQTGTSKFDLSLFLRDTAQGISGEIEFSTELFEADTVQRLMIHFGTLLEGIVKNPEQRIGMLPLLPEDEYRRLVADWNADERAPAPERRVVELIADHARWTPDAPAVVGAGESLTYRQLEDRSNRLAHELRSLGVGPDVLVAICSDRTPAMIVGLLGILKAGGGYVPLDPTYPKERLAYLLADSGTRVLLAPERARSRFRHYTGHFVALDAGGSSPTDADLPNPDLDVTAYVIYTSGSTGKPKGTVVTHRNLINLVTWNLAEYGLAENDRVSQVAAAGFDASMLEIWPTLAAGGSLYLSPEDVRRDPRLLRDWLVANQITLSYVPTPLAEALVRLAWPAETRLRTLITGGDRLHHYPTPDLPFSLVNAYGPTETTVMVTGGSVAPQATVEDAQLPSIGGAVAGARLYVLDELLQPVPMGVPGELYIGGPGVSRGYFRRPDLTGERFLPDLFATAPGSRMYRTGDRVRYRPDGTLEFLGRLDRQVKIRGFRIELGEIESHLRDHPAVHAAVVDVQAGDRLTAYVVADDRLDTVDLRASLQKSLPGYMVPSATVRLDTLPLTPNGKVDRNALPAPGLTPTGRISSPPRTIMQHHLARIWQDLLHVDSVGIHDDFFELGGHSLLAASLVARIQDECGISLPLATMFHATTIAALEQALHAQREQAPTTPLVQVQSGEGDAPFFFLHGDLRGGGLYSRKLARELGQRRPFYVLEPHGAGDGDVPASIEEMAVSLLPWIEQVQGDSPCLVGGYCNGAYVAYEIARRLQERGKVVERLILLQPPAPGRVARILRRVLPAIGGRLGLSSEAQIDIFLRFRALDTLAHAFLGLSGSGKLALISTVSRSLLRLSSAAAQQAAISPLLEALGAEDVNDVIARYSWPIAGFHPAGYAGPVTICWPEEETAANPIDVYHSWRAVAPNSELRLVSGNHVTCITRHVEKLGRLMQQVSGDGSE